MQEKQPMVPVQERGPRQLPCSAPPSALGSRLSPTTAKPPAACRKAAGRPLPAALLPEAGTKPTDGNGPLPAAAALHKAEPARAVTTGSEAGRGRSEAGG